MSNRLRIGLISGGIIGLVVVVAFIFWLRTRTVDPAPSMRRPAANGATKVSPAAEPVIELPPDQDGDGLKDETEKELGTDPGKPDTDGDGLSDFEEVVTRETDPLVVNEGLGRPPIVVEAPTPPEAVIAPSVPAETSPDPDGDGLTTLQEEQIGTDPNKADTDGDGFNDGQEVNAGYNPLGPGLRQ